LIASGRVPNTVNTLSISVLVWRIAADKSGRLACRNSLCMPAYIDRRKLGYRSSRLRPKQRKTGNAEKKKDPKFE
jgi:hypothetical protein